MGNCTSYNEIESERSKAQWVSEDSLSMSMQGRGEDSKAAPRNPSLKGQKRITPPNDRHIWSHAGVSRRRASLDTAQIVDMLKSGNLSTIASIKTPVDFTAGAGGSQDGTEMMSIEDVLEHEKLRKTYLVVQSIASGDYWSLWRAVRISDKKQLLIKKISKDKIPVGQQYLQACENNETCKCIRCAPLTASRTPTELVLLQSRDSGLPQLVDSFEDDQHYYIITKLHGPSQKRWRNASSWFGRGRWSTVYWQEYLT
ncbi:hypothetical protein BASA50_010002 [Batrachochytrium salamandrivorans]|uniref:Protein kinase domain-containing protein n=1 Tax=Batrachochytrium salamandrivorans TaxID=1357716 RepID=A0ABQ8EZR6_9FUNG|nr:hypothetical protein BASA62_001895 [Batrachochytrium salamandrivorans]KAH6583321.1 hypothetical protein BASA60_001503 [Batrachochytrium salamandrivorans]KAH6589493.1 hypothetical protein BASA50_010002 [Batrachochytrium salamandrivorans]